MMGRFIFKLEAVLEQRLQAERRRQGELAQVQRAIINVRSQIASAEKLRRQACALERGHVDVRMLAAQARFAQTMQHKLALLREQLAAAQRDETAAQAALLEAAKGRKVMEKLREKQQAKWNEQEKKREQMASEEAARRVNEQRVEPAA